MSAWRTGKPSSDGYYLVAWNRNSDGTWRSVSEAWYSSLRDRWLASRGYLGQTLDAEITGVIAWMEKPQPPQPATVEELRATLQNARAILEKLGRQGDADDITALLRR